MYKLQFFTFMSCIYVTLYRVSAGKFVFMKTCSLVHHCMICLKYYGSSVVVRCMGFGWVWVGLDLYVCGLGWVVGYENGPMDNSAVTVL